MLKKTTLLCPICKFVKSYEMNIPLKIKKIRELKNYTQEYMASSLEISQSCYNKIENGTSNLSVNRLILIAKVFKLDPIQLLSFDGSNILSSIPGPGKVEEPSTSLSNSYIQGELESLKNELGNLKRELKNRNE